MYERFGVRWQPLGLLRKKTSDPLEGRRLAAVYRRGQTYVVTAHRRFGYGPWQRSPPYAVLERSASDLELGAAVVRAIGSFEYLAVPPTAAEVDDWNSELYRVAGVKDERTFERNASVVEILEERGRWVVEPHDRRRGYWVPMSEETFLHLSEPSPEEVATAVRKVLG